MLIRRAQLEDTKEIIEMGSRSLMEGPYKDEVDNPEQTTNLLRTALRESNWCVLVAEDENKLVGILAFVLFNHPYTGRRTAAEMIWYVAPEYRRSMTAICLVRRAMTEARNMGAYKMQMTAPTLEVGKAYEALGFKALEVAYQKVL